MPIEVLPPKKRNERVKKWTYVRCMHTYIYMGFNSTPDHSMATKRLPFVSRVKHSHQSALSFWCNADCAGEEGRRGEIDCHWLHSSSIGHKRAGMSIMGYLGGSVGFLLVPRQLGYGIYS